MTERNGIKFNEEEHTYTYKGKRLQGVTGVISKLCGKSFSPSASEFTKTYMEKGKRIHDALETYIAEGSIAHLPLHPDVLWCVDRIKELKEDYPIIYTEYLVSDYENVASSIDLLMSDTEGNAILIDYKSGKFDRTYCSMQLSVYQELLEAEGKFKVKGLQVFATKDLRVYDIAKREDTQEILKCYKGG